MRILAIGNSFSQNTTTYLNSLFDFYDDDFFVANLYIPSCSLKEHADNLKNEEKLYEYQVDGICQYKTDLKSSIAQGWDFITLQQFSGDSGLIETYEPYMGELVDYLSKNAPNAKLIFHKTWSYEQGSDHPYFVNYDYSQETMDTMIDETAKTIANRYNLSILGTADLVKNIRLDERTRDLKISLDTYHLNTEFGQLIAAYAWYYYFSDKGIDYRRPDFLPDTITEEMAFAVMELAYESIAL